MKTEFKAITTARGTKAPNRIHTWRHIGTDIVKSKCGLTRSMEQLCIEIFGQPECTHCNIPPKPKILITPKQQRALDLK